jgi:hypothetical protein
VSTSPKPFNQHRAATVFLRVPHGDWTAVKHGSKTEFRSAGRGYPALFNVHCPTPVVAYATRDGETHESMLMVLEKTWREPLGAISPESLEREGFASIAHFRRYWIARTKRLFRPMSEVQVYRVRAWRTGDIAALGCIILQRLYGEHL